MKFHDKLFLGVGATLLGLGSGLPVGPIPGSYGVAAAQEPAVEPEREVEVVKARLVTARPGHRAVHEVRLLKAGGGRLDWSRQGDRIAFDQAGPDGLYDVYLMSVEDTSETCLTCENYDFRKVSVLNPTWHPSGDYLVVQVQESAKKLRMDIRQLASPHRGLRSELWVIPRNGRGGWQLTRVVERGGAVLDPHFSHEASQLVWSERLTNRDPPWGEWGVRVAEFEIKRRLPRLGKVRTFRPGTGNGLVIAHGFTPDDRGLLVSATPRPGLPESSMDILQFDLESETSERLTASPDQRDDLASRVPHSDHVVWASDRSLARARHGQRLTRRSDLWLRSASGLRQERLTFFNDPASEHFLGEALIADLAWSDDGERLFLHVVSARDGIDAAGPDAVPVTEGIYLLVLGEEFRR
ncbi:MAG: hypothetical protein GY856_47975 [bacterium]|nr:hypothetical protein [bacterium]